MIIKPIDVVELARKYIKEECVNNILKEDNISNSEKVILLSEINNTDIDNEILEKYINMSFLEFGIDVVTESDSKQLNYILVSAIKDAESIRKKLISSVNSFYMADDYEVKYKFLTQIEENENELFKLCDDIQKSFKDLTWLDTSRFVIDEDFDPDPNSKKSYLQKKYNNLTTSDKDKQEYNETKERHEELNRRLNNILMNIKKSSDSIVLFKDFKPSETGYSSNDVAKLLHLFNMVIINDINFFTNVYSFNTYVENLKGDDNINNIKVNRETYNKIILVQKKYLNIQRHMDIIKTKLLTDLGVIKTTLNKEKIASELKQDRENYDNQPEEQSGNSIDSVDQFANSVKDNVKSAAEYNVIQTVTQSILYWLNPMTYWNLLSPYISTKAILYTGGIGAVVVGVAMASWYLYKYLFNRDCSKLIGQKRINCLLKVADKAIAKAETEKSRCENTENPSRCVKEIDNLIKKWKIRKAQIQSGKGVE